VSNNSQLSKTNPKLTQKSSSACDQVKTNINSNRETLFPDSNALSFVTCGAIYEQTNATNQTPSNNSCSSQSNYGIDVSPAISSSDSDSSVNSAGFYEYLSKSKYKKQKQRQKKVNIPNEQNITFRRNKQTVTYADTVKQKRSAPSQVDVCNNTQQTKLAATMNVTNNNNSTINQHTPTSQIQRPAPRFGTKTNTGINVVKPNQSEVRCVFVSRFPPNTTTVDVKRIITSSTGLNINCRKLKVKFPELYSSFCLNATNTTHYNLLLNPDVWPVGILVMPFMGKTANPRAAQPSLTKQQHQQSQQLQQQQLKPASQQQQQQNNQTSAHQQQAPQQCSQQQLQSNANIDQNVDHKTLPNPVDPSTIPPNLVINNEPSTTLDDDAVSQGSQNLSLCLENSDEEGALNC
jgi:hypothetical protein